MAAPNRAPVVDPKTGIITPDWLNYFVNLEQGGGLASFTNVTVNRTFNGATGGTIDVDVNAADLLGDTLAANVLTSSLTRTGTLVGGATGAGFTVNLASSTLAGAIGWGNLPTGAGTWTAEPTIIGLLTVNGGITVLDDILPQVDFRSNLGSITRKFLSAHVAELFIGTLVAQDIMATIGGRVLIAPTTSLTADLLAAATSITVKHNNLASGDRVLLMADGKVEWIAITSAASGVAGAYVYSVTRDLDGTGANDWYFGDALVNTGTTGDGFIDVYSTSGVFSGTGPTIVGNVRTGTTYSQVATRWAVGNLNGLYSYASDTYGAAFGDPTGANITLDATNGFRVRTSTTTYAQLTGSTFTIGATAGNRLAWDGSDLTLVSANLTINTSGVYLTPGTSADLFVPTKAYAFSVVNGEMGLSGWDTSPEIGLKLQAAWTGGGTKTAQARLEAIYGSAALDAVVAPTVTATTTTVSIAAASPTVNASVATIRLETIGGTVGGSSAIELVTDTVKVNAPLTQNTGKYLYPGSDSSAYQTTSYLRADATFGLHINTSLHSQNGYYERNRAFTMGAWTTYTPTWTNLTVGNGTVTARYTQIGKTVIVGVSVVWGSTTSIAGAVQMSLPVSNTAGSVQAWGFNYYFDSSAGLAYFGSNSPPGATTIALLNLVNPATNVTATVPFTWTTNDQMWIYMEYEGV